MKTESKRAKSSTIKKAACLCKVVTSSTTKKSVSSGKREYPNLLEGRPFNIKFI